MSTKLTTNPRDTSKRLNKPPLALRVKIPIESPNKDQQFPLPHESYSTNMSCDTTVDETCSFGSKEAFSMSSLNLSHYLEQTFDNSDIKSMSSIDAHDNVEEGCITLNSALKQKKKAAVTDETKYKTEMCKNWSETGQCPYGKKCKFAHGKHELNEKLIKKRVSYKSQKCATFHNEMICPYGVRCLFMHEQRPLKELLLHGFYNKYISCPEVLLNPMVKTKQRLPVFPYLAEDDKAMMKVGERGQQNVLNGRQEEEKMFLKDQLCADGMRDEEVFKAFNMRLIPILDKRVC